MSEEESAKGISRRDFIKEAAVIGAGAMVLNGITINDAQAETAKEAPTPSKQDIISMVKGGSSAQKYEEVMKVARERMHPKCRVCPECDGRACAGEWPGMGGVGSGRAFINNIEDLANRHLVMRTLHDVKKPDMSITLFG